MAKKTTSRKKAPAAKKAPSKPRAPRKPRQPKRPPAEIARDAVILHLVNGGEPDAAAKVATDAGVDAAAADRVAASARQAIATAAQADRPGQLRSEIAKLDELESMLQNSSAAGSLATRMKVITERAKLLGLYRGTGEEAAAETEAEASAEAEAALDELGKVAGHLLGLGLASEKLPLSEHARIAADKLMRPEAHARRQRAS